MEGHEEFRERCAISLSDELTCEERQGWTSIKCDDGFKAWLGQQPSNGKIHELKGGGLKETAQHK